MNKEVLIIQTADDKAPLDYRDEITICKGYRQIEEAIEAFSSRVTLAFQNEQGSLDLRDRPLIQRLNLGSSAAENEFTDLAEYFVETDIFRRALRGEVRIALGRKGSGKTALFSQVRDKKRDNRKNIILDLRPEGYQLIKFKKRHTSFIGGWLFRTHNIRSMGIRSIDRACIQTSGEGRQGAFD
jgi:hypothetical protein